MPRRTKAPSLAALLDLATANKRKPLAVVLAGHNGSGKSSLWKDRLSDYVQIPLINADRLTESILPARASPADPLPEWAQRLRDTDRKWQELSQQSVKAVRSVAEKMQLSFGFETVFSYWELQPDGTHASKADDILALQQGGYFVILLFVGLASADISVVRVANRVAKGGHNVPLDRLMSRFPRTQEAIGHAATIADMTIMVDNSRKQKKAFTLARAQRKNEILFDCRDPKHKVDSALITVATPWLDKVTGAWPPQ